MRLAFIPASSEQAASSRIRVYSLLEPLARLGVRARIGWSAEADAVLVQKRLDATVLEAARQAKRRGALVVYDCDDLGFHLNTWANDHLVHQMMSLADVVTTNTAGFRDGIINRYDPRCVEILRDTIDYWLASPVTTRPQEASPLRLLWFGNPENLTLVEPFVGLVSRIRNCQFVVCTALDSPEVSRLRGQFPGIRFREWSLAEFPALLRACHLTLLTHEGDEPSRAKSNNRMIASIAWGVPAIVSRTPEYERTAAAAGVLDAVYDSPAGLVSAVEAHRSAGVRGRYLASAQEVVWRDHAPDVIARRLVEILSSRLPAACRRLELGRDGIGPL